MSGDNINMLIGGATGILFAILLVIVFYKYKNRQSKKKFIAEIERRRACYKQGFEIYKEFYTRMQNDLYELRKQVYK